MTFFAFCAIYLDASGDVLYNIVDTVSEGVFNATTMFTSVEDLQAKIAEWEMLEAYDFSATTDECPKSFYDISNEYDDAL